MKPGKVELDFVLKYCPQTGKFTRLKILNNKQSIGEIVGSLDAKGYTIIRFNKKQYKAHRLAWLHMTGEWPSGEIDHINGIRSDNRILNLRDVSKSVNQQNRRSVRGYSKDGSMWKAQIKSGGNRYHLGNYVTEQEASAAYISAKEKYHVKAKKE